MVSKRLLSGFRSGVQVVESIFLSTPSLSRNSCNSHTSFIKEFLACCECGKSAAMQGCTHICTVLVSFDQQQLVLN